MNINVEISSIVASFFCFIAVTDLSTTVVEGLYDSSKFVFLQLQSVNQTKAGLL